MSLPFSGSLMNKYIKSLKKKLEKLMTPHVRGLKSRSRTEKHLLGRRWLKTVSLLGAVSESASSDPALVCLCFCLWSLTLVGTKAVLCTFTTDSSLGEVSIPGATLVLTDVCTPCCNSGEGDVGDRAQEAVFLPSLQR